MDSTESTEPIDSTDRREPMDQREVDTGRS
jgi:hypothetical protein